MIIGAVTTASSWIWLILITVLFVVAVRLVMRSLDRMLNLTDDEYEDEHPPAARRSWGDFFGNPDRPDPSVPNNPAAQLIRLNERHKAAEALLAGSFAPSLEQNDRIAVSRRAIDVCLEHLPQPSAALMSQARQKVAELEKLARRYSTSHTD